MDINDGAISFDLAIRDINFRTALQAAEQRVLGFSNNVVRDVTKADQAFDGLGGSMQRLGQLATGYLSLTGLKGFAEDILRVRGNFQQLEIAYSTILKSQAKGAALLKEVTQEAATTPYGLNDIASGAKQLLAYGSSATSVVQELHMLGDVASGVSVPLNDIVYLYGTLRAQGRAYAVDIRQFASRGIPIYQELATVLGTTTDKVNEFVSDGKVGFKEVEQAFKNMTSGGGVFAGLMDAQSKSLLGLKERLSDAWDQMLNEIGKKNEGVAAGLLNTATSVVQNYQSIVDILEVAIGVYGGFKAAVLLANVAQAVSVAATDSEIAAAASRLPLLRAEVSLLAEKKTQLVEVATAQAAALTTARTEAATAQAAALAGATLLDSKKRDALVDQARIAQNNVLAAQESASLTRRNAIAAASEFYAARQVVSTTATTAAGLAEDRLTAAQSLRIAITQRLTALQAAFNASLLSNPIVLAGTAVAALATAYYVFREEVQQVKTAQELMAESSQSASDKFATQKAQITSLVSVIKNQNIAETQRKLAYDKLNQVAPEILTNLDFEAAKTANLTKQLNSYLASLKQKIRLEAGSDDLKAAYKQEFEATKNTAKAQEELNKLVAESDQMNKRRRSAGPEQTGNAPSIALAEQIAAAKTLVDARSQIEKQAVTERENVEKAYNKIVVGTGVDALKAERALQQAKLETLDSSSFGYKQAEEAAKKLDAQIKELTVTEKAQAQVVDNSLKGIQAQIKAKKELLNENKSEAENAAIRADIANLEAKARALQGKKTKAERDADNVGPLGSISYYENVVKKTDEALSKITANDTKTIARLQSVRHGAQQKVNELKLLLETPAGTVKYYEGIAQAAQTALEKTPLTNTAAIAKQKEIIVDAQAQAEQARQAITVRSFDDELSYKRDQYALYYKYVEAYGKETADSQFAELKKSGDSYLDYLNAQIEKLQSKGNTEGLTEADKGNLGSLLTEKDDFTGAKSRLDTFNESMQKAQVQAGSLANYLRYLDEQLENLGKGNGSGIDQKILLQLNEERVKTKAQLQANLQQFLESYASSGEQQLAIQKDFADKRLALDQRYGTNRGREYKQALTVINSAERDALEQFQQRQFEESEAFKATTKTILGAEKDRLKEQIRLQKNAVEEAKKYGLNSEVFKQAQAKLDGLTQQDGGSKFQKSLSTYGQVAAQIGQALQRVGGQAGELGVIFSGLASNIDLVVKSMDKSLSKTEKTQLAIGAAIDFAASLYGTIANAANQRANAEKQYASQRLAAELQYNKLLVEQIGLKSKLNESVFLKDYAGEAQDGLNQLSAAQDKLSQTLARLRSEGKAKDGQRNAYDLGAVASSALQGAATGAALGTAIPGLGTVVGAIGGFIVGGVTALFGAKKKQDIFVGLLKEYPELINNAGELNVALAQTLVATDQVDDATKQLLQSALDWTDQIAKAKEQIKSVVADLAGTLGNSIRDSLVQAFEDGTDASIAFGNSVNKVLENILSNLLFNAVFAKKFKALEQELSDDFDSKKNGGNVTDAITKTLGNFFADSAQDIKTFQDSLATARDKAKQNGLDIFGPSGGSANANSPRNAVQAAITENTANLVLGQLSAQRTEQANQSALMRQQLLALSGIKTNTDPIPQYLPNLEVLNSIDRRLKSIQDNPTGRGLGQDGPK